LSFALAFFFTTTTELVSEPSSLFAVLGFHRTSPAGLGAVVDFFVVTGAMGVRG